MINSIIDDDGKDVRTGEAGEMIIRGQIVTKGYHNNPAANEEAFVDGWYKTGDIGSVKERKVYLVDRKKVGTPSRSSATRNDILLRN